MRQSNRAVRINDCEGGDHPGDMSSASVWNQLTCKAFSAAETNGNFNAAALLYGRDPRRARPSLEREEKPPTAGTTSLQPMLPEVNATQCCM